jgi:hypothetical protein
MADGGSLGGILAAARALLVALALGLALPGAVQAAPQATPPAQGVTCIKCKSTGRQPCPEHTKEECAREDGVLFCSVIADCATCGGTGWLLCPFCENADAKQALENKRARVQQMRPLLAEYDERMGRPLRKSATEHFTLVWEIESLKVDKRTVGAHELLHMYSEHLERVFTDYCEVLKVGEREFAQRAKVFVWWLPNEQMKASLLFCGQGSQRGVKLMGSPVAYSMCGNRQFYRNEEMLHRNLVHCVSHLLLSHQSPSEWIGNKKGGWAEEGLAHWFEDRYWGVCDTYCYEEQDVNVDFKGGKYRVAMRKLIAEDKSPPLMGLLEQNTDQLTLPQHCAAFSFVDFLIHLDGAKFNAVCRKLRAKVSSRDALQAIYKASPLELESQWKAWVLETYPKQ